MRGRMFRKILVFGIIMLFVGASAVSTLSVKIDQTGGKKSSVFSEENSWPMFHHDIRHTGFSEGMGNITKDNKYIRWKYVTGNEVYSSPAIGDINDDGHMEVVVASLDHNIYALDANNGTEIWRYATGGKIYSSPALGDLDGDGLLEVVIGCDDYNIYALNGLDGSVFWKYKTNDSIASSPLIGDINSDGKPEVVVGSMDKGLYALYGSNGSLMWSFDSVGYIWSSPALGDIDNDGSLEVVVGSTDMAGPTGVLYALNGTTGEEKWNFSANNWMDCSPAIGDINGDGDMEVVIGSRDHNVYALHGSDGSLYWSFSTSGNAYSSPAIGDIDNDGKPDVVIGSMDNYVYAIDGTSGEKKWSFKTFNYVKSSPALCDIDGDGFIEVIVGSWDTQLYVLDGVTGEKEWSLFLSWLGIESSPAVGDIDGDGYAEIVVGGYDNRVFAIDDKVHAPDPPEVDIYEPRPGYLYIKGNPIWKIGKTIILGCMDFIASVKSKTGVSSVLLYVDDEEDQRNLVGAFTRIGVNTWKCEIGETIVCFHKFIVVAYSNTGDSNTSEADNVFIICLKFLGNLPREPVSIKTANEENKYYYRGD